MIKYICGFGGQGETRTPDVSGVGRLQRLVFATRLPTHINGLRNANHYVKAARGLTPL